MVLNVRAMLNVDEGNDNKAISQADIFWAVVPLFYQGYKVWLFFGITVLSTTPGLLRRTKGISQELQWKKKNLHAKSSDRKCLLDLRYILCVLPRKICDKHADLRKLNVVTDFT